MTVELADLCARLKDRPRLPDVLRAYELLYGAAPDPERPALEVAQEVAVGLSLLAPAAEDREHEEEPMGQKVTTEAKAADGRAMTAAELEDFLRRLGDRRHELRPRVRISFGGGIKSIKVEEER